MVGSSADTPPSKMQCSTIEPLGEVLNCDKNLGSNSGAPKDKVNVRTRSIKAARDGGILPFLSSINDFRLAVET